MGTATKPREQEATRTRHLPPYHVILENDPHHSFDFVIRVLREVLACPQERAFELTWEAHHAGRAVVWTGPREVAELKAEQIRTFHETRPGGIDLGPLGVLIEPAPG